MAPRLGFYPDYPPRVRVEWLIATTRVVLAGGALLATTIRPFAPGDWITTYSLGWYLVYSLVVLALVWMPVRFARGWTSSCISSISVRSRRSSSSPREPPARSTFTSSFS